MNFQPVRLLRTASLSLAIFICLQAKASPQEALLVFDGFCVATRGQTALIERMADARAAQIVPDSVLATDPAVARFGGKGFAINDRGHRFMVVATPVGSCSILWMSEYTSTVATLVEANYPLTKPRIETSGAQIVNLYRLLNPSTHAGSYISIMRPKSTFTDQAFFTIGFVPAEAAITLGIKR